VPDTSVVDFARPAERLVTGSSKHLAAGTRECLSRGAGAKIAGVALQSGSTRPNVPLLRAGIDGAFGGWLWPALQAQPPHTPSISGGMECSQMRGTQAHLAQALAARRAVC
jgi:hypothetical protein